MEKIETTFSIDIVVDKKELNIKDIVNSFRYTNKLKKQTTFENVENFLNEEKEKVKPFLDNDTHIRVCFMINEGASEIGLTKPIIDMFYLESIDEFIHYLPLCEQIFNLVKNFPSFKEQKNVQNN